MDKVKPRTLSGFMELMPGEQLIFNKIVQTLEEVYRSYGFVPLDTPVLEASDVLLAKAGGETEKQIYRFSKGDTDIAMRYDLTVPLAKYVSMYYNELAFPFKRYQIGKVYRGERAQRGRFREFYQADIDIVGDGGLALTNDAEIPAIICEIFTKLGLGDFTVRINNRKVLYGLFSMLSVENSADEIMRIVDKTEKAGADKVRNELLKIGVSQDAYETISRFISIKGDDEIFEQLRTFSNGNEMFDSGVNELEYVFKTASMFGQTKQNLKVDLSIARGLDYYTGTVYETVINKHPEIGSVCSGGRYDDLAGFYSAKALPGVGISIGLTRLFYILGEIGYLDDRVNPPVDVLIIPMTEDFRPAISLASYLRNGNINAQVYYEDKKFKNKMNYANKISAPFVIFLGEDEIAKDVVTLKNFLTGEQVTIKKDEAAAIIRKF